MGGGAPAPRPTASHAPHQHAPAPAWHPRRAHARRGGGQFRVAGKKLKALVSDLDEFEHKLRAAFCSADEDESGLVSRTEFYAILDEVPRSHRPPRRPSLVSRLSVVTTTTAPSPRSSPARRLLLLTTAAP